MDTRRPDPRELVWEVRTNDPRITLPVHSEIVYFPLAPGVVAPAWSQVVFTSGPGDWYILSDARGGALLYRKNLRLAASTQPARFSVYAQADGVPADSPAPATSAPTAPGAQPPEISRSLLAMLSLQDPVASPNGWIPDDGTTTTGNNVDAYLDRDGSDSPDAGALDSNGRPIGNTDAQGRNRDFVGNPPGGRNFDYSPAPAGGNPNAGDDPTLPSYQRGVVTQLFYLANFFHDRLYQLGFDEGAGNFQTDNFGRGGAGGDPVLAEAQQGAAAGSGNNANFSPGPDGTPGIMRMFLWNSPVPVRDGSLDATIALHD